MIYLIPITILATLFLGIVKKVSIFDSFIDGTKATTTLLKSLIPYLVAIFIAIELFRASGLSQKLADILAYPFSLIGVPSELIELIVLKPISGSGSLVALENIFKEFGADSYIGRVASVLSASSDTIVYIVAVYFSTLKDKKSGPAIPIALGATIFGTIIACLICKVI